MAEAKLKKSWMKKLKEWQVSYQNE